MKRSNRIIIGTLIVDDLAIIKDIQSIVFLTGAFVGGVWGNAPLSKNLNTRVFVESEPKEPLIVEGFSIMFGNTPQFESMIELIESAKGKSGKSGPNTPEIMFGIGSKKFCQACVHFWATGRSNSASNWGLHLIRRISESEERSVSWYDTGCFGQSQINKMVEDMIQI